MSIAVNCMTDISERVQQVSALETKTFTVMSDSALLDKIRLLKPPSVGVMYLGLSGGAADATLQGLPKQLHVGLIIALDGRSLGVDKLVTGIDLLDEIRDQILKRKAPTQRKWIFLGEEAMGEKDGLLLFSQRWSTGVILNNLTGD